MEDKEEKIEERATLLRRLYWVDEIHKIGKELNIDSIKEIENYWDLDYKISALQISRILSDSNLQELISHHPPKYLEMGGFHGQFYTIEENKKLELNGSWNIIAKNIQRSIEKYRERSYGILKALLNKNGRTSYIDLLSEIEKIIGWDYTPSALLSRLTVLKLVYKTGSNKYPRWEIPEEIIPVVKKEIEKISLEAIKSKKKEKAKRIELTSIRKEKILSRDLKLDNVVFELVDLRSEINMIFLNRHHIKLFKDNEKAIMRITKPCGDEEEFTSRINWLSVIVTDDFELDESKKLVKNSENIKGSIDFMETYLKENNLKYDENLIKHFRMLKLLRNKKYPIHPDDGKFLDATDHFGQSRLPLDWTILWESVLKSVKESFMQFRDTIQNTAKF